MKRASWRENDYACRNCGRVFPVSKLDRRMWCPDCRGEVIRRARLFARIAAISFSGGLAIYIFTQIGTSPRFMTAYLIMVAAAYFLTLKLTQRLAFDLIREKGVPPPFPNDEGPAPTQEQNG